MQAVSAVVGARPFGIAVVAGGIASFGLGAPLSEAVRIGAAAALAGGIGDTLLSSMGYDTYFDSYYPSSAYIDVSDVVAGAGAMALLEYIVGVPQQPLLYHAAIAGLACGVGPKLTTLLLAKAQASPVPDSGAVAPTQTSAPVVN
jgi:hypothetical protein